MFEESDDVVVTSLIGPVETGLLLVLLLEGEEAVLGGPGQEVDVCAPLQEVVDDVDVSLVAGGVEGSVTVRSLAVD